MRILFVAPADCAQVARWISLIADQSWDIHLFPTTEAVPHPSAHNLTLHTPLDIPQESIPVGVRVQRTAGVGATLASPLQLAEVIREIKPNIVHSLSLRPGSDLVLEAHRHVRSPFPIWVASDWTNEPEWIPHQEDQTRLLLSLCDYYMCDPHRDSTFTSVLGFRGKTLRRLVVSPEGIEDKGRDQTAQKAVEMYREILAGGRCPYTAGAYSPEPASAWERLAETEQWLTIREEQLAEQVELIAGLRQEIEALTQQVARQECAPQDKIGARTRFGWLTRSAPYRAARLVWRGCRSLKREGLGGFSRKVARKCARITARSQANA